MAGGMCGRLGLVCGPGGGDDGVSMSIAGCYDRGVDPSRKFQNLDRLLYCKSETTGQNSALNCMGGASGGGP